MELSDESVQVKDAHIIGLLSETGAIFFASEFCLPLRSMTINRH